MAIKVFANDNMLSDDSFLKLGFQFDGDAANAGAGIMKPVFDVERAVNILKSDQYLAAKFLSQASGNGSIFWTGRLSEGGADGKGFGVMVSRKRDSEEVSGDNSFGRFLDRVKREFTNSLTTYLPDEVPVRPMQVITDYLPGGAFQSMIEEREKDGERFIHVDVYRPAKFRFDTGKDGTTGHAARVVDDEVPFKKFECPFGTAYPSPVIVGSEAEASVLYEQALRGELDWEALFINLKERGLLASSLTERQIQNRIMDYKAQFEWMREQIANDSALRRRVIIASNLLCKDHSMGRSVMDGNFALSPAHVLAYYINNPIYLHIRGENRVIRSLGLLDKSEPQHFEVVNNNADDRNVILVGGSDTIGGREPGAKASKTFERYEKKNNDGSKIIGKRSKIEIPLKDETSIEADYAVFSKRMDSVIGPLLNTGKEVTLVSGNFSSKGERPGVGTAQLVARYVREKGGDTLTYDFLKNKVNSSVSDSEGEKPKLHVLMLEHFSECLPALVGISESESFRMSRDNEASAEVTFTPPQELKANGMVCFSSDEDQRVSNVFSIGSLAASAGIPVIHVINNESEERQEQLLGEGANLSLSGTRSGEVVSERLFEGKMSRNWPFTENNHLSSVDEVYGIHTPLVSSTYPSPVLVGGYSFYSPLGAYLGMVAQKVDFSESKDYSSKAECIEAILKSEGNTALMMDIYRSMLAGKTGSEFLGNNGQETALRGSVRLFSEANLSFRDLLLGLDGRNVVMSSSVDESELFVSPSGEGENRFGLVLAAEAGALKSAVEARRIAEVREREKVIEESEKRQRLVKGAKAEAVKVKGGMPENSADLGDAVWFIGTNDYINHNLPDDAHSFEMWDVENNHDPLTRAKAALPYIEDIRTGDRIDNDFVFLFPSDLRSVVGRSVVTDKPSSLNLTGVMRKNPKTGEMFPAAVGIPVKVDGFSNEIFNPDNLPCSFRLDDQSAAFINSVVIADASARRIAIHNDCALALTGSLRSDGTSYYILGQVFMPKRYSRSEKAMVNNPHKAPINLSTVETYIKLLERGRKYPLNVIPLPRSSYDMQDSESYRKMLEQGKEFVSPKGQFISDLKFTVRIMLAYAALDGKQVRFPLDPDGRIDFGPGVPEEYRIAGEELIDSLIGVKKDSKVSFENLPYLERIPAHVAGEHRDSLVRSPKYIEIAPNDLAVAFGGFDFNDILLGHKVPLHQMSFRDTDGDIFTLNDVKLFKGMEHEEDKEKVNGYLNYTMNDKRRFSVRTTNPDKVEELGSILKMYAEKANAIKVEARLVSEGEPEARGLSMDGFVNLLPSNSDEFVSSKHDIGREATHYNARGTVSQRVIRNADGTIKQILDDGVSERDVDGNKIEEGYHGKVVARDGFRGWGQFRYTLPDGSKSDWITVNDLDFAKDMVMSMVRRTYRMDDYVVPSDKVMEMFYKSRAVEHAGERFREMKFRFRAAERPDDKVIELKPSKSAESKPVEPEKVVETPEVPTLVVVDEKPVKRVGSFEFTESSGSYAQRTRENAQADDVDFTVDVSVNMRTPGERCTKNAAGNSFIGVELKNFTEESLNQAVMDIYDSIPEDFRNGEPIGLNFAGNGISTLNAYGITQETANDFAYAIVDGLLQKGLNITSGRSGGQNGMDLAFALACKELGIDFVCHAPKNWMFRDVNNKDICDEKQFKSRMIDTPKVSKKNKKTFKFNIQ